MSAAVDELHRIIQERDFDAFDTLLADDCVFHSPIVHTPQEGKGLTMLYLKAAFGVFGGSKSSDGPPKPASSKFHYVREVVGEHDAVLEFMTEMDGITVNGVDMIRWNDAGQIVDFKVMVRPLKAIQKVHGMMAAMLEKLQGKAS